MQLKGSPNEEKIILFFILASVLVYLTGWQVPLMEIDAAQYASMSREMLLHRNFLELYDHGKDYLDKPPMLFWLSSLSMYLFGINDFAYRLPSYLFALLSVYSVYKFALLFYPKRVALLCALALASCQAMFLINHDVRTDTMLMGWVTLSIWQLADWYKTNHWKSFFLAALAISGGMLTKGPIALMVPVFAFAPHFILQRSFKQFLRWEYILLLAIIGVLLIPMSMGLYRQYDLHPEKTMYGQKGISGLRFYYWTQSFGRITGESTWHENDSFFFLFENMLWGFLPWILFFIVALLNDIRGLFKRKFRLSKDEEWISTGGFLVTYCALGMSRAQLPHYIYVVFPMAAVITGRWVAALLYTDEWKSWVKPFFILHAVIFSILAIGLFLLLYYPFPPVHLGLLIFFISAVFVLIIAIARKWIPLPSLLLLPVLGILLINICINTGFYPSLLKYQMSVKVSRILNQQGINKDHVYIYKMGEEWSLGFYSNHDYMHVNNPDSLGLHDYLLTGKEGLASLDGGTYRLLYEGQGFHVSMLSLEFLNPSTRRTVTTPYYIIQKIR